MVKWLNSKFRLRKSRDVPYVTRGPRAVLVFPTELLIGNAKYLTLF